MENALTRLAKTLTASQATSVAASLEIDGRLDRAASFLPDGSPGVELLSQGLALLGQPALLASVLRGYAAAAERLPGAPRAVWSGPSLPGDGDHTTAAVSHLIDEAKEDVLASTFSASITSPFVEALWRAVARGVSVTVVLEGAKLAETAVMLSAKLQGARFLHYVPPVGQYGVQHSKVVVVDAAVAFVTSANFSDAAAHRNLETGVLVRDPDFASTLRRRFSSLTRAGALRPFDATSKTT